MAYSVFLVAVAVIGLSNGQVLYPLYKFSSAADTILNNVEAGSHLYIVSNDSPDTLSNIFFINGNSNFSAYFLYQQYELDGKKTPWQLESDFLYVTTSNSDIDMERLAGNVYITTAKQAADPNFFVYDVYTSPFISLPSNQLSTTVILNLKWSTLLYNGYSCLLQDIKLDSSPSISMFSGIPTNVTLDNTETRFFTNPVTFPQGDQTRTVYFNNIEPTQVSFPVFYIVSQGSLSLNLSAQYNLDSIEMTTSHISTGLMQSQFQTHNRTVNFIGIDNHNRTAGIVLNAKIYQPINVTFFYNDQVQLSWETSHNAEYNDKMITLGYAQTTKMVVSTRFEYVGEYSIQYFVIDETELMSTTVPTTTQTTTTPIPSTSKSPSSSTGRPFTGSTSSNTTTPNSSTSTTQITSTTPESTTSSTMSLMSSVFTSIVISLCIAYL